MLEADGDERPAETGAGVDDRPMGLERETRMGMIVAGDDEAEAAIGLGESREAGRAPPERVALGGKRPLGIDPGIDEEERRRRPCRRRAGARS